MVNLQRLEREFVRSSDLKWEIPCTLFLDSARLSKIYKGKGRKMFKQIKGFEGLYEVSDTGFVKAVERTILNKHGKPQRYPEKLLKFSLTSVGRHQVVLSKDHKRYEFSLHRVVAENFIPNPDNKPEVNHIDNNPLNNCVSNLEWCTRSENMIHAQKQGRLFNAQSKGGKNRGISGKRFDEENANWVGTTMGNWTIQSIAYKRGKKLYFNVTCQNCGTPTTREKHYIKHIRVTHCNQCASKVEI